MLCADCSDIEGPSGGLMTENGGPIPLMGEPRGEWSWVGDPNEGLMPELLRDGCSRGPLIEPRILAEFREPALTWVEKSLYDTMVG